MEKKSNWKIMKEIEDIVAMFQFSEMTDDEAIQEIKEIVNAIEEPTDRNITIN